MQRCVLIIIAMLTAGWAPCVSLAQGLAPTGVVTKNFGTDVADGWVRSATVFGPHQRPIVEVYIHSSSKPVKFRCMDYADFTFDLRNSAGDHVDSVPTTSISGAVAPHTVPEFTHRGVGNCPPHPFDAPRLDGGFRYG